MNIEHIAAGTTLTTLNGLPAMSSQEIAEVTGKKHHNVLRDIRRMLAELGIDSNLIRSFQHAEATVPDRYGRLQPMMLIDKELTLTLLSRYSFKLSNLIVRRWLELEGSGFQRVTVSQAVVHLVEREKDVRREALRELRRMR